MSPLLHPLTPVVHLVCAMHSVYARNLRDYGVGEAILLKAKLPLDKYYVSPLL